LIELMFAGFVLTVGMLGSLIMIMTAMQSNSRSKFDSTGTMVAQLVMEHINTMPTNQTVGGVLVTSIPITDCTTASHAAETWNVSVIGMPIGVGQGATLDANNEIDWTQIYDAVPNGYKMRYYSCGDVVWEVRWRIVQVSTLTKTIIVSARQSGTANAGVRSGFIFSPPVTLRTVSGP
jgi:Tfp pilus assembly protein PilV